MTVFYPEIIRERLTVFFPSVIDVDRYLKCIMYVVKEYD